MKMKIIRQLFNLLLVMLGIGYIVFLNINIESALKVGLIFVVASYIRFYMLEDKNEVD